MPGRSWSRGRRGRLHRPVLEVYDSVSGSRPLGLRAAEAAVAILLAAVAAGALWALPRLGRAAGAPAPCAGSPGRRWRWRPWSRSWSPSPRSRIRSARCETSTAFTELAPSRTARPASPAAGATATTTGASRSTSSRTSRCAGVGAGNYDRTYFLERRTTEDIRQPHSIELQTLGELASSAGPAGGLPGGDRAGFVRRRGGREDLRARGLAVAAGGASRLARAHERGLAASDPRGDRDRALLGRRAGGPMGRRGRTGAGKAGVAVVAVCGLAVLSARCSWAARRWPTAT